MKIDAIYDFLYDMFYYLQYKRYRIVYVKYHCLSGNVVSSPLHKGIIYILHKSSIEGKGSVRYTVFGDIWLMEVNGMELKKTSGKGRMKMYFTNIFYFV